MPTPISTLLPKVLPFLPGCSEFTAEDAIREAAIDFCERSGAIQRRLEAFAPVADQEEYSPALAPDECIAKLLSAKALGDPLTLTTPAAIDDLPERKGVPTAVYSVSSRRVALYPVPAAAGAAIRVRVAIKPTPSATTLPDELVDEYGDDIAKGAISLCAAEPGKPYSNPDIAGFASGAFEGRITKAKVDAFNANSRANQRVPPHYF